MDEPANNAHPQDRIAYTLRQKQVAFGRESEVAAAVVAYLGLVDTNWYETRREGGAVRHVLVEQWQTPVVNKAT